MKRVTTKTMHKPKPAYRNSHIHRPVVKPVPKTYRLKTYHRRSA